MPLFKPENTEYIRQEFFKLNVEMREKILFVASVLADKDGEEDVELRDSVVFYFTQKKNHKELEKLHREYKNDAAYFRYIEEKPERKSQARGIKIVKKKK